jgi:hypothetical protein
MSTPTIEDLILQELDCSSDDDERIKRIDDLLHILNFERRVACLSDAERHAMVSAGDGRISPEMRQRIDACKSEAERKSLIDGYARTCYFRQCAWSDYLNGVSKNMPFYPAKTTNVEAIVASSA